MSKWTLKHYPDMPWPERLSDGLILPCGICGNHTIFDYTVSDETWNAYAPSEHKLGVICLPCFAELAPAEELVDSLQTIQVTLEGATAVCECAIAVIYRPKEGGQT